MIPAEIFCQLRQNGIEAISMHPLKPLSTFRIGGEVELAVFPRTMEQLIKAVSLLRESGTPFSVIGNGSNLLFGDGLLKGALIVTKKMTSLPVKETRICADGGVSLAALANGAPAAELAGLDFARRIPGTVGGAVFMNAGAYGGAISDVLVESLALSTESGEMFVLTEHAFDYRKSIYMNHPSWICLGATFDLQKGRGEAIRERMRELSERRKEKQPLEFPSAGSYFKRPEGHFAGKLIEDCGLKGFAVGDAAVSEKHAGFLINRGNATAAEMLTLEEHVRETVFHRYGVMLEREVRLMRTIG